MKNPAYRFINKRIINIRLFFKTYFYYSVVFLCTTFGFSCSSSSQQIKSSVRSYDLSHKEKSHIIQGNILKTTDGGVLSLSPGKIVSSEEEIYYVLKLDYGNINGTPRIYPGDKILLNIDGTSLELESFDVVPRENQVTVYYQVDKFDLIDMGNANTIKVKAFGGGEFIEGEFTKKNIDIIRTFCSTYVLPIGEVPVLGKPQRKNVFVGFGAGSSYELWIGYYDDVIKIKSIPKLSDFIALNLGFSRFESIRLYPLRDTPPLTYKYYGGTYEENIAIIGAMYGFTHPVDWLTTWSLEVGFTLQVYFSGVADWDHTTYIDYGPPWYYLADYDVIKSSGEPYDGTAIGFYIQAGSIWFRLNTFGAWAGGLSVPLMW